LDSRVRAALDSPSYATDEEASAPVGKRDTLTPAFWLRILARQATR